MDAMSESPRHRVHNPDLDPVVIILREVLRHRQIVYAHRRQVPELEEDRRILEQLLQETVLHRLPVEEYAAILNGKDERVCSPSTYHHLRKRGVIPYSGYQCTLWERAMEHVGNFLERFLHIPA